MAETIGSLIDKLCIAELKVFHMREQTLRPDAASEHRRQCRQRHQILQAQRSDLAAELTALFRQWSKGRWRPKIYRQFKMYNDPRFRVPLVTVRAR